MHRCLQLRGSVEFGGCDLLWGVDAHVFCNQEGCVKEVVCKYVSLSWGGVSCVAGTQDLLSYQVLGHIKKVLGHMKTVKTVCPGSCQAARLILMIRLFGAMPGYIRPVI